MSLGPDTNSTEMTCGRHHADPKGPSHRNCTARWSLPIEYTFDFGEVGEKPTLKFADHVDPLQHCPRQQPGHDAMVSNNGPQPSR